MLSFPYFHSKILLFGEYSLLYGSMALSMPSNRYKGRLNFATDEIQQDQFRQSNQALQAFGRAMQKLFDEHDFSFQLNAEDFLKDVSAGLFFESNIPQGYGLGSSGAVVAAVTDAYGKRLKKRNTDFTQEEIVDLKKDFAKMESFFHGKSSGLDPLISFLNKPILVESKESLRALDLPAQSNSEVGFFMIDSGNSGETQPLVELFNQQCENKDYFDRIEQELIPLNNLCIQSFLNRDISTLNSCMQKISDFTFINLNPMVPESIKTVWKRGLDTANYSLKLCGSGGGGMILGFSTDMEKAESKIPEFNPEVIYTL